MTWVRFEDDASEHPKVAPLDDATYRLWHEAILWSSRRLTDGAITCEQLTLVSRRANRTRAARLVARVLWHEAGYECASEMCPKGGPDGWIIHDYFDYQPRRAKVLAERAAQAARTQKWREAREAKLKGRKPRDGVGDASHHPSSDGVSDTVSHGVGEPSPTPSPPRRERGTVSPDAPPAADGGVAAAGGERADQKQTPAQLGAEDPAVIEADRRRLEALAAHQESLNLEAEERARRGAAAARAALPPSRVKPPVRRPNPVFVEAVDNPHYDPTATLNGGAA